MLESIQLLFSETFLIRALVVGVLISLCSALLGISLVLKRFSMIGDGLSHVGFGAMAVACAANIAPLYFALPVVIVAAFLLLRLNETGKVKGDTAIALISTGALAAGVMVTSMTTGMNVDIYNYMFGSILTMSDSDVAISAALAFIVIMLFVIFYHEIFAVTFDESFARATGTRVSIYNMLIAALTAVTIVVGMRMMGALLISALIIFPTVTASKVCRSFKAVVLTGAAISVLCFVSGLVFSIELEAPTGASVVCVNIFAFALFSFLKRLDFRSFSVCKKLVVVTACFGVVSLIFAVPSLFIKTQTHGDKLTVVTTSFAPYSFAREVVGNEGEVTMLLSPGEESHTYEPTPSDIMLLKGCDVFVYGGGESETWADTILSSLENKPVTVRMMDVTELYHEEAVEGMEHEHSEDEEAHTEEYDEHVWTSPINAMKITEAVCEALCTADLANSEVYNANTEKYITELEKLDGKFSSLSFDRKHDYVVIGDRFPLRYLMQEYGIDYYAAFPGCSAQVEANPATIAFLNGKVSRDEITTVFKVDLSTGTVAYSIAEETGAAVDTLYSCHVISAEDFENGETYISLMGKNFEALKKALF